MPMTASTPAVASSAFLDLPPPLLPLTSDLRYLTSGFSTFAFPLSTFPCLPPKSAAGAANTHRWRGFVTEEGRGWNFRVLGQRVTFTDSPFLRPFTLFSDNSHQLSEFRNVIIKKHPLEPLAVQ